MSRHQTGAGQPDTCSAVPGCGIGVVAFVPAGLNSHAKAAQEACERAAARAPEGREVHNITCPVEDLLRIKATDLAACPHFHTEIPGVPPRVHAITTLAVMDSPTDDRGRPPRLW